MSAHVKPFFHIKHRFDKKRSHPPLAEEGLICIASRPGMGKTALALSCALTHAEEGKEVHIFAFGLLAKHVRTRLLCLLSQVALDRLQENNLTEKERTRLFYAEQALTSLPIVIHDDLCGIDDVVSVIEKAPDGSMAIIDPLYVLITHDKEKDYEEASFEILRILKRLSRAKHMPIFVLSYLLRTLEYRKNPRPTLSDLDHASRALKKLSDTVIFPYRDSYYHAECTESNTCTAEIIIPKNRHGKKATLHARFDWRYLQFSWIGNQGFFSG